jgi:hypothetical protein
MMAEKRVTFGSEGIVQVTRHDPSGEKEAGGEIMNDGDACPLAELDSVSADPPNWPTTKTWSSLPNPVA